MDESEDIQAFFAWVDDWWYLVSEWLEDPGPIPDADGLRYRAALLPSAIFGESLQPLKGLLKGMIAFTEPSAINGPRRPISHLHELSDLAWDSYQRINAERQKQCRKEAEKREKPKAAAEWIGPFQLQWLKMIFEVEHNDTLKNRLGDRLKGSGRKWTVDPTSLPDDWEDRLKNRLNDMAPATRKQAETFLSLQRVFDESSMNLQSGSELSK